MSIGALAQRSFYKPLAEEDNTAFTALDSMMRVAEKAMYDDLEKALILADEIIRIGKEKNSPRRAGYGHFYIGMSNMGLGNWQEAKKAFLTAIEAFREIGDSLSVATASDRVGYAFRRQGYLSESLKYHLHGLKLREAHGASALNIGNSYAGVGGIYYQLKEYDAAIQHYQRAFALRKSSNDTMAMALSMKGLGRFYRTMGVYDSSLYYLNNSLGLFQRKRSVTHIYDNYKELGLLFRALGRLEDAERTFLKGLTIAERSLGRVAFFELELGKLYLEMKNHNKAQVQFLSSRNHFINSQNPEGLQEVSLLLSELAKKQGDYEKALSYLETYSQLKDSLYIRESNQRLAELRTSYEVEQNEAEIENLRKERKFRTRERNSLFVGILALVIFIIALYYAIRQRAKAFKKLLAEKNKSDALLKEKEELYENLQNTQAQLVQSEKLASLGQLTAGIAHEINNPINFISANSHALQLDFEELEPHLQKIENGKSNVGFLTQEIQELIEGIQRGATRTKEIVSNLSSFTRQSDGRFEKANLHEGIDTSLAILNSKMKDRITIHKHYGKIPEVECQYLRINQVLLNLINNAIDAIEGEGEIHIGTALVGEMIKISITDSGAGISKEAMKKIFEPFYTTKEIGKGTGLGLSISYGIIQNHNGRIDVQSLPGKGSTFSIYLPIEQH